MKRIATDLLICVATFVGACLILAGAFLIWLYWFMGD